MNEKTGNSKLKRAMGAIIAAVLLLIVLLNSIAVIPAGHTGVLVTMGRVSEAVLQEGVHIKMPFVQSIVKMDNRITKLEVTTEAFSKDLQTISSVLAVNYRIDKNMSYSIYKNIGSAYESVAVIPAVHEVLKAIVAQYTASELVSNRSEVSVKLDEMLNEKLMKTGISVETFNIIDWDFSPEYIAAVEQKQVAEQNLIKTRTEQEQAVVIAEAEAQKKLIAARADAEKLAIESEAKAKQITLEAEAQAKANKLLAESLSPALIQYEQIKKWDGVLPKVSTGNSSGTLIQLPQDLVAAE
jgi:regulator of protease activity HflC (stomatin/prohibitin superfamily)